MSRVVTLIRQHRDASVVVEGHTDAIGSANYNQALSVDRAKSVVGFLGCRPKGSEFGSVRTGTARVGPSPATIRGRTREEPPRRDHNCSDRRGLTAENTLTSGSDACATSGSAACALIVVVSLIQNTCSSQGGTPPIHRRPRSSGSRARGRPPRPGHAP
jgi:OmpA family